jgi:hypothetical protein
MIPPKDRPDSRIPSWLPLAVLIVLSIGLRVWVIARTEVAARDSIGFIRTALRFENEPWLDVIRTSEQPPGYALTVLAVSRPLRAVSADWTVDTMVLAAQLASAMMAVLTIFPMVRLGREIGNRQIGWLAAGLLLALPGFTRLTSDGLSEATFLFWVALSLWLGVRALRQPGAGRLFTCGLGIAAAYLTRPEGLELAIAAAVALLALQFSVATRQSWRRLPTQFAGLMCGVLVGVVPYVAITGHLTNKNTPRFLLGDPSADPARMLPYGQAQSTHAASPSLAVWLHESDEQTSPRWLWALQALTRETAEGFQYIGLALAILGLIVWRSRPGARAGTLFLLALALLHALILCRMASLSGYLSERHTLLFLLIGSFPAAAALLWLGHRFRPNSSLWTACAVVGVMLTCELVSLRKPLHGNRAGHKAAGRWLAQSATPNDAIIDPFNWAEFYARPPLPPPQPQKPDRYFIVLENGDNPHSRLPVLPDAKKMAALGTVVYHWPEQRARTDAKVLVYEMPAALMSWKPK